jgi:hypothetical protein
MDPFEDVKTDRTDYPVVRVSKTPKGELDIRFMYFDNMGELAFTKKGVRVPPERVAELMKAIQKVLGS